MDKPLPIPDFHTLHIAVVPLTECTLRLVERVATRCVLAGIEIALVGSHGEIVDVRPTQDTKVAVGRSASLN